MTNGHNSIELAKLFREIFDEKFEVAQEAGAESFLIDVKRFDEFCTLLESYPTQKAPDGTVLPAYVPKVGTAEWHRHINFRNSIRKLINRAAQIGSHIQADGTGYPPYEVKVNYIQGPPVSRGPNAGKERRHIDKQHYVIRLLSATARVLHREVQQAIKRFAEGKVKHLTVMNSFIGEHIAELPPEIQLAHKLRGKRTEDAISLATEVISRNIRDTEDEYREVVAFLGSAVKPPVALEHIPEPDEEDDDD